EQNRGALCAQRRLDRIEGGVISGLDVSCTMQSVRQLIERGQLVHAPRDRLFGATAVTYVAGDLRRADNLASAVAHRRYRQRDVDPAAVLPAADGFEVLDPLSAANPTEDFRLLDAQMVGDDHGDRLPDRFLGGVPEKAFGASVPAGNDAV